MVARPNLLNWIGWIASEVRGADLSQRTDWASPSQEACTRIASWCPIQSDFGVTRKEVWEQGVAGSSPVAPTLTSGRHHSRGFR